METLLVWGLALLLAAMVIFALDIFIPSGGLLSLLALGLTLGGLVCLFRHDTLWGLGGTLFVLVLGPIAFFGGVRVWQETPIGRAVIGAPSEEEVEAQRQREASERRKFDMLVGLEGVALTDLRPVGVAEVDGQRLDVLSETTFVRAGTRIKVTSANPAQIKVRPLA